MLLLTQNDIALKTLLQFLANSAWYFFSDGMIWPQVTLCHSPPKIFSVSPAPMCIFGQFRFSCHRRTARYFPVGISNEFRPAITCENSIENLLSSILIIAHNYTNIFTKGRNFHDGNKNWSTWYRKYVGDLLFINRKETSSSL